MLSGTPLVYAGVRTIDCETHFAMEQQLTRARTPHEGATDNAAVFVDLLHLAELAVLEKGMFLAADQSHGGFQPRSYSAAIAASMFLFQCFEQLGRLLPFSRSLAVLKGAGLSGSFHFGVLSCPLSSPRVPGNSVPMAVPTTIAKSASMSHLTPHRSFPRFGRPVPGLPAGVERIVQVPAAVRIGGVGIRPPRKRTSQ